MDPWKWRHRWICLRRQPWGHEESSYGLGGGGPFWKWVAVFFFPKKNVPWKSAKKKRNPRFHMEESVGKKSHIKTFQLCLEGSMITLTDLDLFFCVIFVHGLGSHGMNPPPFFTSIWNIFVGTFFPSIKQQANPRSTLGVMIFWKKWGGSTSI